MTQRNGWQQSQTYAEVVFWREHRRAKRRARREARLGLRPHGWRLSAADFPLLSVPDFPLKEVRFGPV